MHIHNTYLTHRGQHINVHKMMMSFLINDSRRRQQFKHKPTFGVTKNANVCLDKYKHSHKAIRCRYTRRDDATQVTGSNFVFFSFRASNR